MKDYINYDPMAFGAEDAEDVEQPTELLQQQAADIKEKLEKFDYFDSSIERGELLLNLSETQLKLTQKEDAWDTAKRAYNIFTQTEYWEGAVQACNVMFVSEQPSALVALGNGCWLAVTFPINPELSVVMMEHIIDETPNDSDGGAVAAAAAHYIAELRSEEGKQYDNLTFFTNQILVKVARRHSEVENQDAFNAWMEKLKLNEPKEFLPRLGQVLEILVQDDWWVDRDALREKLPVN